MAHCEYRRNGTVNMFIFLDAHRPWRKVKVTDRRTAENFAICMRELSDVHFPEADRIRVVLDNLSTHSSGALYQAFPPCEARRVLRRLEFHYVPKRGGPNGHFRPLRRTGPPMATHGHLWPPLYSQVAHCYALVKTSTRETAQGLPAAFPGRLNRN